MGGLHQLNRSTPTKALILAMPSRVVFTRLVQMLYVEDVLHSLSIQQGAG
jgi:hypothetical protein